MSRSSSRAWKFVVALFPTTVICAVVWQFTASDFYDCTDDVFPGYFELGWVHNLPNNPIKTVGHIVHGRDMGEPDTIKEGWSVPKLWCLWCAFFGLSLVGSAAAARISWTWQGVRSGVDRSGA